jgi:hypothetical protein
MPLVVATTAYFATVGPALRAYGGAGQDLGSAVQSSVATARADRFDVVFLGNSRVVRGVDPSFIESRAHNFAFDDDSFLYYPAKVRFLERTGHHVRVAFVGVDVFQLGYWNYDRYFGYREALEDPALDAWAFDARYAPTLTWRLVEKKTALRTAYRSAVASLAKRAITGAPPPPELMEEYHLELNGFCRVVYRPRKLNPELMPPAEVDARAVALLEEVVRSLRAGGAEVVLFSPPASARFRSLYDAAHARFEGIALDIATRNQARFVSWETDPGFTDADFPDEVHLSPAAAERFSRMLSAWMKSHDLAPVD